jgi:hypothetical protein
VGGDFMQGLFVGGVGVGADAIEGVSIGGIGIAADQLDGLHLAGAYLRTWELQGVATGAYTRVMGRVEGLTIGIFNWTPELHGVQIGLLNYAGNNPRGLKWLPGINLHFD